MDWNGDMVRLARVPVVAGLISILLLSAGCGVSRAAYEVTTEDLAGTWVFAGESHEAQLTFAQDGTYEAGAWPKGLICSAPGAWKTTDVDWGDLVQFTGTWRIPDEASPYLILFSIDSDECSGDSWTADVWHNDFGPLEMSIYLPSADPADLVENQFLSLVKTS